MGQPRAGKEQEIEQRQNVRGIQGSGWFPSSEHGGATSAGCFLLGPLNHQVHPPPAPH